MDNGDSNSNSNNNNNNNSLVKVSDKDNGDIHNNNNNTDLAEDRTSDFEAAIEASGFGKFNILLLFAALFSAVSSVFQTSTVSYILPVAECDLKLTLLDKGVLNAITYAGMMTSSLVWGYIADTKGRKKLLVIGYFLDTCTVLMSSTSQTVLQLMIFKFMGGFVACGPLAILMSYLSELHGKIYRTRIILAVGIMYSTASLVLPILALFILPDTGDFMFCGLMFHSWQVFLAVCSIPSFVAATSFIFFPESPKFLMSQGRNAEALEIFRTIYAMNKNMPRETFTITKLADETSGSNKHNEEIITVATVELIPKHMNTTVVTTDENPQQKTKSQISIIFMQLRPLLRKPYLSLSLLVYFMNFFISFGQNTVRLWLPQLFASISEYQEITKNQTSVNDVGISISMCDILEYSRNKTKIVENLTETSNDCDVIITFDTYFRNIIVGLSCFVGYFFISFLVGVISDKRLLTLSVTITACGGIALYFSSSADYTLLVAAVYSSMGSVASTSLQNVSVNLFPTSLRTMVLSLGIMFGRAGSLLGNVIFPIFISLGCFAPFLMVSLVMFSASILSALLPNTTKTSLK